MLIEAIFFTIFPVLMTLIVLFNKYPDIIDKFILMKPITFQEYKPLIKTALITLVITSIFTYLIYIT